MIIILNGDLKYFEKIKNGDETAFSELFREYYQPLYRFAGRFISDSQTSENVVQDIFVKMWTERSGIEIKSNLKSYLFSAVRNQCLNVLNRENRVFPIDEAVSADADESNNPAEDMEKTEQYSEVAKAVESLPEQCRRIYLMKRYDGMSYNEIAEALGISVNTVKTQIKRALKLLTEKLQYLKTLIFLIFFLFR